MREPVVTQETRWTWPQEHSRRPRPDCPAKPLPSVAATLCSVDEPVMTDCTPVSGSAFPVGRNRVTCTGQDALKAGRELFFVRDHDNPDTTHFLQLEDPETCAALTLDFLEEQGVA